jgi:2-polyprenyl-6-methoxyphenol hydroxylase-like FAD-dependent oxidoreductase
MNPKIAIIGAGIGGLTLAVALKRRGLRATVYEAAPKMEAIGAGIWLGANAMKVMERLELAPQLNAAGVPLTKIELADQSTMLSTVELERIRARLGQTTVSILRSELQRVLVETVGTVNIATGKRADSVEPSGLIRFTDGTTAQADIVVGADGLKSAVRQAVEPAPLRYSGQTCYRGVAELELPPDLQTVCRETWGGECRFGYSAVDAKHVYWFAVTQTPAGGVDEGPKKPVLTERYAKFPGVVPAIVAATREEAISRLDIYDLQPLTRWWKESCVLLGDAAHAMTPNLGQGGGQAIEDAWSLARHIATCATPQEAFAKYQDERMARARHIVKVAWTVGQTAHWTNPLARALRNAVLRGTPDLFAQRNTDEIYAYDPPA